MTGSTNRVPLLRANDSTAWESFYDEIAGPLRAYVARLGSRTPDDTVGEVMVQVVRDITRFQGSDEELRAWTFGIARNRVIDEGRRRSRRPQEYPTDIDIDTGPAAPLAYDPDPGRLGDLLDLLTPDQREVVWLRYGADLSLADTASIVGKDSAAVAALAHRGLRRLRALLDKGEETFPWETRHG